MLNHNTQSITAGGQRASDQPSMHRAECLSRKRCDFMVKHALHGGRPSAEPDVMRRMPVSVSITIVAATVPVAVPVLVPVSIAVSAEFPIFAPAPTGSFSASGVTHCADIHSSHRMTCCAVAVRHLTICEAVTSTMTGGVEKTRACRGHGGGRASAALAAAAQRRCRPSCRPPDRGPLRAPSPGWVRAARTPPTCIRRQVLPPTTEL